MAEVSLRQRDIVLLPFPFSDQSGKKVRPALVLSNDRFNQASDDVVVCAITSNLKQTAFTVLIDQTDIENGILYDKSAVKVETMLNAKKVLVLKTIATIKQSTFAKVTQLLAELVKPA